MKKLLVAIAIIIGIVFSIPIAYAQQNTIPEEYQLNIFKAKILSVEEIHYSADSKTQIAQIEVLNRELKGTIAEVRNTLTGNPVYDIDLKDGRLVTVHMEEWENGNIYFYVLGYERSNYILQVIGIFLVSLILIGGKKGLKAIVALGVTILLVIYLLIPLLLRGFNPIPISILVCALSSFITLTIIAGWNKKSISAIIGTVAGLVVGGLVAYIYGIVARLTGFNSAEAQMLLYIPDRIELDYRGLLFSGILIGALGAAMDVSISISSALSELYDQDPKLSFKQIINHGMNIGRDIMGTMANTLVLAYAGGALSMIMIFVAFNKTLHEIVNLDSFATEILRAAAGSIGLLFAIPFTAVSFAVLSKKRKCGVNKK